jgi:hypothetical protein
LHQHAKGAFPLSLGQVPGADEVNSGVVAAADPVEG